MLKKSSSTCLFIVILIFIFNLPLSQAFYQQRRYVHVPTRMTWSSAQTYCRRNHIDLATFRHASDMKAAGSPCSPQKPCWIGYQRETKGSKVWNWSDGDKSSFVMWGKTQPDNAGGNQDCTVMNTIYWFDRVCSNQNEFLCYDDAILVKENKTWEDALEHCRNKSRLYNLPYVDFDVNENSYANQVILDAQTPEVWIGLRFLAGEWLWVNGTPLNLKPQYCPADRRSCGTMSKMTLRVEAKDCLEKRNFFCSKDD